MDESFLRGKSFLVPGMKQKQGSIYKRIETENTTWNVFAISLSLSKYSGIKNNSSTPNAILIHVSKLMTLRTKIKINIFFCLVSVA